MSKSLQRLRIGEAVSPARYNDLVDAINAGVLTVGEGLQLKRGATGTIISVIPRKKEPAPGFYALITGSSEIGATNKYTYSWKMVEKSTTGYGGWTAVTVGGSEITGTNDAYNLVEDGNVASGTQGNGVANDGADYPAGFDLQPVPDDMVIVWMQPVLVSSGGVVEEFWFSYENSDDGTCEAP